MNEHDLQFMKRALELARQGVGLASPNPTVGCVVVNNGAVIGEGFHQYEQRDHAEIVALKQAGERAKGATLYVTLEPCNHHGRTGPCSEAILDAGIARVVAAMEDPNPKTAGGGFAHLRRAGIAVDVGVQEEEAQRLNEGFSKWITTREPFVTLKSALTLDGQLALRTDGKKKTREWITDEEARREVQNMRHASDALLTGIGTVLVDNPYLTDRSGKPRRRKLLRVILDSKLRIPLKSHVVQSAENDVLVFTAVSLESPKARALRKAGVEVVRAKRQRGRIDLRAVLKELGRREILSVILEAGPHLNGGALAAGIVDKVVLFYAPKLAGSSDTPFIAGVRNADAFPFHLRNTQSFGADIALEYVRSSQRASRKYRAKV